ncbi:heavy-metal-associated domain-containing protein [Riemerella columbina]|uniref:heavy-metal-associated domain-containing protein n=1 Tax=Riemerella columbina TaxID=103810 RepID=UPI00266EBF3E|nr:cation transporter [Riemerella columbina]WKS95386.1 cation transporter [Riemerella columbina]
MKNLFKYTLVFLFSMGTTLFSAQISNAKTETAKVYGNCGMCKKTIEKAINQPDVVAATWDKNTKILTFTYDTQKTNRKAILKKVADAGYDNELYRAGDVAYGKLHQCCQYKRPEGKHEEVTHKGQTCEVQ